MNRLHAPAKQIELILTGVTDACRLLKAVADVGGLERVQQCLRT